MEGRKLLYGGIMADRVIRPFVEAVDGSEMVVWLVGRYLMYVVF